ncbi:MAG TPA: LysR family transcriptional regulator, partial [Pilimelia sp.]|nr:LysR family transcriptional regulator [Pilimelia sp.]
MDPQRLLVFRQVARAGSLAAAARALGLTQPAVSQHLRALERDAGVPLVLRHSRGVRLTEAGETLARHADGIAARLRAARTAVTALAGLDGGTVRLFAFPSAAATLGAAAVAALARRHPGLDVRISEADPPEALAALGSGAADVALSFAYDADPTPPDTDLVWSPLHVDPVRLVLPATHPGSGAAGTHPGGGLAVPDLSAFRGEKWITGGDGCTANLVRLAASAGFTPDVRHGAHDFVVAQALVARGLGVA